MGTPVLPAVCGVAPHTARHGDGHAATCSGEGARRRSQTERPKLYLTLHAAARRSSHGTSSTGVRIRGLSPGHGATPRTQNVSAAKNPNSAFSATRLVSGQLRSVRTLGATPRNLRHLVCLREFTEPTRIHTDRVPSVWVVRMAWLSPCTGPTVPRNPPRATRASLEWQIWDRPPSSMH